MMETPLISIIVPVYKTEQYLDRCVESIVNQTYQNLEIILVDDGSPDSCPQMCDDWAKKDSRIKVIHKENDGLANARNSGIEACTGDYVIFTDSDDYIEPDMVEFLVNLALDNDADVARCGLFLDFDNGKTREYRNDNKLLPNKNEILKDLVDESYNGGIVCNKLYRKDVINVVRFSKDDGASEDILFNYRVYSQELKAVFKDVPKYHYIVRENSITNSEFNYGAFSIIEAKQYILDQEKRNFDILEFLVRGYIVSAFIVLSGVITNQKCLDRYDQLRNSILKYKKQILFSNLYSKRDKIKTIVLMISPKLYNKLTIK